MHACIYYILFLDNNNKIKRLDSALVAVLLESTKMLAVKKEKYSKASKLFHDKSPSSLEEKPSLLLNGVGNVDYIAGRVNMNLNIKF